MENENKIIPGQDTPEVVEEAVVNDAAPAPEVAEEVVVNDAAPAQEVVAEQPETTEKRCPKCFALIADEQMFCPECGVPVKKMCANCKTELQDDQSFCPVCGTMAQVNNPAVAPNGVQYNDALNAPKKKFKAWPIIVGVVAVVVLIMALIISNSIKEKKIEEYVAKAQNFYTTVLNSGAEMEDIGNEIQTAWGKYVVNSRYGTYYNGHYIYSIESAVSAAQDEKSTEISNVQSTDGTIESMYRFLMDVPDSDDPYLQEIKRAAEDVYDAYKEMYDVIIDVSGSYITFKSEFSTTDTNLLETLQELDELVKNYVR